MDALGPGLLGGYVPAEELSRLWVPSWLSDSVEKGLKRLLRGGVLPEWRLGGIREGLWWLMLLLPH